MLARLRAVLALGLLALGLPLFAQLDPRLQVKTPDFLDLFTGGSSSGGGAQIFFLLDCSGAMQRVMFHKAFPNEVLDEDVQGSNLSDLATYKKQAEQNQHVTLTFRLNAPCTGMEFTGITDAILFEEDPDMAGLPYWQNGANPRAVKARESIEGTTVLKVSGKVYTIGGPPISKSGKAVSYAEAVGNILVKPDGSPVTLADVQATRVDSRLKGSADREKDARNWIRAASHVRLACTPGTVTYGGADQPGSQIIRFVDIPLPWTALGAESQTGTFPLRPRSVGGVEIDQTYLDEAWDDGTSGGEAAIQPKVPRTILYAPWDGTAATQRPSVDEQKRVAHVGIAAMGNDQRGNRPLHYWLGAYRTRYLEWIFWSKLGSAYMIPDAVVDRTAVSPNLLVAALKSDALAGSGNTVSKAIGFANGVPGMTRMQAMKEAMMTVIQEHGSKHQIAFRFLDVQNTPQQIVPGQPNFSLHTVPPGTVGMESYFPAESGITRNNDAWNVANTYTVESSNLGKYLRKFGKLAPNMQFNTMLRPLNRGYYTSLLQYNVPDLFNRKAMDPNCGGRYLVVLGTGASTGQKEYLDQGANANLCYLGRTPDAGNQAIKGQLNAMTYVDGNTGGAAWHMANLAGLAAFGGRGPNAINVPPPSNPSLEKVSDRAPFWVKYPADKAPTSIHTMTVGMGLGERFSAGSYPRATEVALDPEPGSPRHRLMSTAACGNPKAQGALTIGNPYDPADPNSIYYFEGRDPVGLVQAFKDLMDSIGVLSGKGSVAAPTLPVAGMGLGHQMYLTKFEIPEGNGTTWKGDLMMFPTREEAGRTVMLDLSGATPAPLSGPAEPEKAQWAASKILQARAWKDRKVFTRLPNATSWMQLEVDKATLQLKDSTFALLKGIVGTGTISKGEGDGTTQLAALTTDAAKKEALLWLLGKGAGSSNRDNLMGDVINSTPAVAEYNIDSVKASLPDTLATALNGSAGKNPRFRVIFVGTNQGQLHAFGEISWEESYTTTLQNDPNDPSKGSRDVTRKMVKGVADELWAFVPTDFLTRLHYLTDQKQALPHRYLVDGTALVYHLDLPASGSRAGNGKIDADSTTERARLVFGLGRGGRSYYALDIKDPMSPSLAWAHLADESGNARIQRLGATTATPTVGRVQVGKVLKDGVFLGGGYSHDRVDAAFNLGVLGRSVIAVDVNDGTVLKGFSLPDDAGPVVAQVVPLDFYINSGLVQRVYAADHKGSIWALGANAHQTLDPYKDWRMDDSTLDNWSDAPRKVFDGSGAGAPVKAGERMIGTAPSVFSISNFYPVAKMKVSGKDVVRTPATVGITFTTGDRFNPKDSDFALSAKPDQNHLHVIFDRNDVWDAITPKDLYTPTTIPTTYWATKTPEAFYQEYKGYRLKLNNRGSANFAPKGLVEPLVLAGTLFFSDFREVSSGASTDGGCGSLNAESMTARVCDVLRPVFPGMEAQAGAEKVMGCASGRIALWYGVASRLAAKGVVSGLQAGLDKPQDQAGKPTPAGDLGVKTLEGNIKERFARPRVWRTVQDGL